MCKQLHDGRQFCCFCNQIVETTPHTYCFLANLHNQSGYRATHGSVSIWSCQNQWSCISGSIGRRKGKWYWWGIWATVLWSLWCHRNDVTFNDPQASSEYVGDMILIRSWMCLKAKVKGFSASFHDWSSNPAVSLYQL